MQYQSECQEALKSVANIHKPFEKSLHGCNEIVYGHPRQDKLSSIGTIWRILGADLSKQFQRKTHLTGFHLMSNLSKSTCMVQERQLP